MKWKRIYNIYNQIQWNSAAMLCIIVPWSILRVIIIPSHGNKHFLLFCCCCYCCRYMYRYFIYVVTKKSITKMINKQSDVVSIHSTTHSTHTHKVQLGTSSSLFIGALMATAVAVEVAFVAKRTSILTFSYDAHHSFEIYDSMYCFYLLNSDGWSSTITIAYPNHTYFLIINT